MDLATVLIRFRAMITKVQSSLSFLFMYNQRDINKQILGFIFELNVMEIVFIKNSLPALYIIADNY